MLLMTLTSSSCVVPHIILVTGSGTNQKKLCWKLLINASKGNNDMKNFVQFPIQSCLAYTPITYSDVILDLRDSNYMTPRF